MHCTLQAFEQFGALYMHNHDDKYPARLGFDLVPPDYKLKSIRMSHRGQPKNKINVFFGVSIIENNIFNPRVEDENAAQLKFIHQKIYWINVKVNLTSLVC